MNLISEFLINIYSKHIRVFSRCKILILGQSIKKIVNYKQAIFSTSRLWLRWRFRFIFRFSFLMSFRLSFRWRFRLSFHLIIRLSFRLIFAWFLASVSAGGSAWPKLCFFYFCHATHVETSGNFNNASLWRFNPANVYNLRMNSVGNNTICCQNQRYHNQFRVFFVYKYQKFWLYSNWYPKVLWTKFFVIFIKIKIFFIKTEFVKCGS